MGNIESMIFTSENLLLDGKVIKGSELDKWFFYMKDNEYNIKKTTYITQDKLLIEMKDKKQYILEDII